MRRATGVRGACGIGSQERRHVQRERKRDVAIDLGGGRCAMFKALEVHGKYGGKAVHRVLLDGIPRLPTPLAQCPHPLGLAEAL
jgi:hypothetical protein